MNILIACEESQRVCAKFRECGHNAFSCDILEPSGGHLEWHIHADVLPLLDGNCEFQTMDGQTHIINGKWDLLIAFPPCTHLAISGARHFEVKREDGRQREGIEFFAQFLSANCDHICIENPVGIISGKYIEEWFPDLCEKYGLPKKPTQIIQPWQFGDNAAKKTCLWLKGLPTLIPTVFKEPEMEYVEWEDKRTGRMKRQAKWYADAWRLPPAERARVRSMTFPGVAAAMARRWSQPWIYFKDNKESN